MRKILTCFVIFFAVSWAAQALGADIYISAEGTVTSFDVVVSDPDSGENRFLYEDITDFEALGPDDVHGGIKYRIMPAEFMPAGVDHSVVVRACNQGWCDTSDPLITGRPEARAGSLMIQ